MEIYKLRNSSAFNLTGEALVENLDDQEWTTLKCKIKIYSDCILYVCCVLIINVKFDFLLHASCLMLISDVPNS